MTEQEIFDTVLTHLREQRDAAADLKGSCQYRGANWLVPEGEREDQAAYRNARAAIAKAEGGAA